MRDTRRSGVAVALLLAGFAGLVRVAPVGSAVMRPAVIGPAVMHLSSGRLGPLLIEPADGFSRVDAFIASARRSVSFCMYELKDATVERELVADAHRGVKVRVLLDRAYHGGAVNAAAFRELASGGVAVRFAPRSTIVHEKAIVVDGNRALIATFNLADISDYYATTRDFGVFDSLPADVAAITRVFDSDWAGAAISAPPPSEDGRDLVWSPGSEPALVSLIAGARHSLLIESEEMSDARIVAALDAAARRGVAVEVVMTADRSFAPELDTLARAGVQVRTIAFDAVPYIHAKVVVVDAGLGGRRLFVGSENFSSTSLDENRELGLVIAKRTLVQAVARTVRADFAVARPWKL